MLLSQRVGGTVGDIESLPFLETPRQMKADKWVADNVMYIHTTLLPYLKAAGEMKPNQPNTLSKNCVDWESSQICWLFVQSNQLVKELKQTSPVLWCGTRSCHRIIGCRTPLPNSIELAGSRYGSNCLWPFEIRRTSSWYDRVVSYGGQGPEPQKQVKISLVGKYVELQRCLHFCGWSLKHSGYANDAEVKINWINANDVTVENVEELLSDADGIIVPGGFGQRGTEGENPSHPYARENDVPMLGVCLGMQLTCMVCSSRFRTRRC